jgi:alkylated DNA repair dioxygenase AlkB
MFFFPDMMKFGSGSVYFERFLSKEQSNELYDRLHIDKNKHKYVDRSSQRMLFRGNPLKRSKIFLTRTGPAVNDIERKLCTEEGALASCQMYRYTGFQYEALLSYQNINTFEPLIASYARSISSLFDLDVNHAIVTSYRRELGDYIGAHNDKTRDMADGKGFVVLTLGPDIRTFRVTDSATGETVVDVRPLPGSLLYMSWDDNLKYKHEILPVDDDKNNDDDDDKALERISIVFRQIDTTIDICTIMKHVVKAREVVRKRKYERSDWFIVPSDGKSGRVHNDTNCIYVDMVNDTDYVSVGSAKGRRKCKECF